MNVYMIRHQAAGLLDGVVLSQRPTNDQLAQMRDALSTRYGHGHPRYNDPNSPVFQGTDDPLYGSPWDITAEEVTVLDDFTAAVALIQPPEQRVGTPGQLPRMVGQGTGSVSQP